MGQFYNLSRKGMRRLDRKSKKNEQRRHKHSLVEIMTDGEDRESCDKLSK